MNKINYKNRGTNKALDFLTDNASLTPKITGVKN